MKFLKGLLTLAMLASCAQKLPAYPETSLCIVNAKDNELRCVNHKKEKYVLPIAKSHKFICTPSEDYLEVNAWMNEITELIKMGITNFK